MRPEDLLRLGRVVRVRDPHQYVVQRRALKRGGVEVRLEHLRRLCRVEPCRLVPCATGHRTADGPGGERLRPSLGGHRVRTTVDRIPHEGGCAWGEIEGIEDVNGAPSLPRADGEVEI